MKVKTACFPAVAILFMAFVLPVASAQSFQKSQPSLTAQFNSRPIGGHSQALIYTSKSDWQKYITAHINLYYAAGQGTPRVDVYEIRTPQRTIEVYANNGQPYVHFFEAGACYPSPADCRQSTIPETDFVPFKGSEFRGQIEAKIETTPVGPRFVVKMHNNNILVAVDMESMQVVDGIVEVNASTPTPIRRHASWLPGVRCRKGLTCYERFHRAGHDQLTRGRIRWANGTLHKVRDRSMSQRPDDDTLYRLGHQRVWKLASEETLPGFRPDRRASLSFVSSHAIRSYPLATLDFLQAFEDSVRHRTRRPQMAQYYGYAS